jgi:hypothetical protein
MRKQTMLKSILMNKKSINKQTMLRDIQKSSLQHNFYMVVYISDLYNNNNNNNDNLYGAVTRPYRIYHIYGSLYTVYVACSV